MGARIPITYLNNHNSICPLSLASRQDRGFPLNNHSAHSKSVSLYVVPRKKPGLRLR